MLLKLSCFTVLTDILLSFSILHLYYIISVEQIRSFMLIFISFRLLLFEVC